LQNAAAKLLEACKSIKKAWQAFSSLIQKGESYGCQRRNYQLVA
jgi:hypothetical protein